MSEEERYNSIIQEIKEIYLTLTQGEPSPDDEIEARTALIEEIKNILGSDSPQVIANLDLFEETLTKLESWDTLELWFTESELPEQIRKIINLTEELKVITNEIESEEIIREQARNDLNSVKFDINKIVDQVSDKFRGEINDLKQEIDFLKHELETKDESLKQVTQKRVVKKIVPKKDVKLPPPKIKIPVVGKPEVAPQVKAPNAIETEKPAIVPQVKSPNAIETEKPGEKIGVKSIEDVQAKIEEEIKKLKPSPLIEEKPKLIEEMHEEAKSVLSMLEELEPSSPFDKQAVKMEPISGEKSILDILDEEDTVLNIIEPRESREKGSASNKARIVTEASLVEEEIPKLQEESLFGAKSPTIKALSVEEIETEEIKSSGSELFNVFSSVGSKPIKEPSSTDQFPSLEPVKDKKKKEEKKKKKDTNTMSFVNFGDKAPQVSSQEESSLSTDELPKDKDTLYQELIALEGRRYSLEKNFKEIERSYNMGSIDDFEYKSQSDDLKKKLDEITSRINRIRRIIASM
ncbi:MAG: hypothetical protein ACFFA3_11540 [Promethearchaeota archaeon]